MGDDPLRLGGLSEDAILAAVEERGMTKKSKDPVAIQNAKTASMREERLANKSSGGGAPKVSPPAPPPPPPPVDKSALLDKLEQYRERFPHLKSRNKLSGKSTADEIEDELHYVQQQLGKRDGHIGGQLYLLALSGIEEITMNHYNPLGLQLHGLSAVARQNQDEFAPILDELFIKYGASMYVGPEMRLAMATATLIYTVHAANNGNTAVMEAMRKAGNPVKSVETDL